jgi:hypothetical protein
VTPLYPQKLALTSPTGGGRSVGIVRSRTKATEEWHLIIASDSLTIFYYRGADKSLARLGRKQATATKM